MLCELADGGAGIFEGHLAEAVAEVCAPLAGGGTDGGGANGGGGILAQPPQPHPRLQVGGLAELVQYLQPRLGSAVADQAGQHNMVFLQAAAAQSSLTQPWHFGVVIV